MRFGIKTAPQMTTWDAMRSVWQAADDIELFESAWNFDHFEPILGKPRDGACLEGWTMLAAMAQATRRIRLGVMVTGVPYRHPAVLANMAATVDVISDGRLELGLGAGWNTDEAGAYGIDLGATLTERFDRFDEACEVVIGLLTEQTYSFSGKHFTLTDAHCEPKGVQRPHPPVTIGGDGEKRTLRAVARFADRWNTPFADATSLRRKQEVLAGHCADIGRDPAEIAITAQVIYMGPEATAEACASLGEAGLESAIVYLPEPEHRPQVLEPLAEALRPLA
ncbi:MAG TPA: LLM class F420-dependent oxidoreductase [Microthrixaceae bacterium]|nr:LLM class F420-dependent oxidoreductase [Microthrixaceae bacterium]